MRDRRRRSFIRHITFRCSGFVNRIRTSDYNLLMQLRRDPGNLRDLGGLDVIIDLRGFRVRNAPFE